MLQATTKTAAREARAESAPASEFLTFRLGREEYGIEILRVQEIRGWEPPTSIPNAAAFVRGVINLRGTIVPVVDLRVKFGLERADYDAFTVVIILNVARRVVGIVVDSVSDVIALSPDEIRPAPDLGAGCDTRHLLGLGTVEGRMLILLDIEKLMTGAEMGLVDSAAV
jgi:purine-binding chemotaxis protein CheW